jgi:hypothetical protein
MIQVVWWPLVAGVGLLVLLVAQPLGRPAPTLAQRLAALRPDQRPASPPPTSFASPTLERLLVPPLQAAGRRLLGAAEVFGLPTGRLTRRLALAGEPGGPALHAGQKLLGGLVGLGLLPLLTQLGITPFGVWPAWTWLAGAIAGFVAPDLALAHKAARRLRSRQCSCRKLQSRWSVSVAGHNRSVFYGTPAVLMALTSRYPAVTIGVALATPARDQFALPTK